MMKKMAMEAEREGQRVTRDIDGEKGNNEKDKREVSVVGEKRG